MHHSQSVSRRSQSAQTHLRRRAALAAATLAVSFVAAAPSFGQVRTWTDGNGNWSLATNWNPADVPDTAAESAVINNGSAVTLNGSFAINNFTLGTAADSLITNDNTTFTVNGNIANSGLLTIRSLGNTTRLSLLGANNMITGGGTIELLGGSGAAGITGNGSATNVDNLIRGQGTLGNNSIAFTNAGEVRATTGNLLVDPSTGGFTNTGTIGAAAGGTLTLTGAFGGAFNNAGGTVLADGGDVVLIGNASITGGTFASTGTSATVVNNGQIGSFTDITNSGSMRANDNSDFRIDGTITNNGTITIATLGNATDLEVQNSATLNGTGTVVLAGGSEVSGINGSGTLTVGAGQTIRGRGRFGQNAIGLVNGGTVLADGGTLTLDPSTAGFDNNATFRAQAAAAATPATLLLTGAFGGAFDNAGGVIEATAAASEVQLQGEAAVTGGVVRGTGGGVVRVLNNQGVSFTDVTFAGAIAGNDNSDFRVAGTITNNGTVTLTTAGNATDLVIQGDTALAGNGSVVLAGGSEVSGINGSGTLTVGSGQTIRGRGRIGQNAISVVNNGLILADGGTLTLDPRNVAMADGEFDNNATLRAAGGTLLLTGAFQGNFDNTGGVIEATAAGSEVQLQGGAAVTGGTVRGTGGGVVRVLNNQAVFFTDVTFAGAIAGNDNSDFGIDGTITNNGTITLTTAGNGTDLEVQDSATLAGTGTVVLAGGSEVSGIRGTGTLTVGSGQTIRGRGRFGQNAIGVVNNGTTIAEGGTLTIDPSVGGGFDNNNVLRAAGGTLLLTGGFGGAFANDGGVIEAVGAGSEVQLTGAASVTGGTIRGTGGGVARVLNNQAVFFTDVTFEGAVAGNDNSDFRIAGTITNNGTITLTTAGNATDLETQGNTTLGGTGTVVLAGASNVAGINGTGTLTVGPDQTIRGRGRVGQNAINIANAGLVVGDVAGAQLQIDALSSFANTGTIRAVNGGQVRLGNGLNVLNNTGGTIEALAGSEVFTLGTGTSGSDISNFTVADKSLNGGTYRAIGGSLSIAPSNFDLAINRANLEFSGQAQTDLFDAAPGTSTPGALTSAAFAQNAAGATVRLDDNLSLTTTAAFTNNGTLTVVNGASFTAPTTGSSGLIAGNGTVGGAVSSTGTVSPGETLGEVATLNFGGDAAFTGGTFAVDISGLGSNDLAAVTGALTIGPSAVVDVTVAPGFTPSDGDTFAIATFGSVSGNFLTVTDNLFFFDFTSSVDLASNTVFLTAVAVAVPEPLSLATLGLLGGGLLLRRRR